MELENNVGREAVMIDVNNCYIAQSDGAISDLYLNLVKELHAVNDKRKDSSSLTFNGRDGNFSIMCHRDDKAAFLGHFKKVSGAEIAVKEVASDNKPCKLCAA